MIVILEANAPKTFNYGRVFDCHQITIQYLLQCIQLHFQCIAQGGTTSAITTIFISC